MSRPPGFTPTQVARMRELRAAKGSLASIVAVLASEGVTVSKSRLGELVGAVLSPGRHGSKGVASLSRNCPPRELSTALHTEAADAGKPVKHGASQLSRLVELVNKALVQWLSEQGKP